MMAMVLRKLPLHSHHVPHYSSFLLQWEICRLRNITSYLYPQKWHVSLPPLFWCLYHSGVWASLCLCFPSPSTFTLHLFICFSLPVGSTHSWLLCHDCWLLLLPWVAPSVSSSAFSVFCILSPWERSAQSPWSCTSMEYLCLAGFH